MQELVGRKVKVVFADGGSVRVFKGILESIDSDFLKIRKSLDYLTGFSFVFS